MNRKMISTSSSSSSIESSKMTQIYWPSSLHGYMESGTTMARHLANFRQLAKWKEAATSSASHLMKKLLYLLLMTRCMVNRVITAREAMTSGMIDSLIFLTMLATVFTISDASVIVIDTSVPSSNGFHSTEEQVNLHPAAADLLYPSHSVASNDAFSFHPSPPIVHLTQQRQHLRDWDTGANMRRGKINDTAGKDEKDAQRRIIRMVEAKLDDRSNHLINDENVFSNKVNEAFTLGLREERKGSYDEKSDEEEARRSGYSFLLGQLQRDVLPSSSSSPSQTSSSSPLFPPKLPDGILDQAPGHRLLNPATIYHGNEVLPLERQVNDGLSHRTAPLVIDSSHSAKQDLQQDQDQDPNQEQTPTLEELQDDLPPIWIASDVPRVTPDGDPIYEGDIVFPRELIERAKSDLNSSAQGEEGLGGRTAVAEPVLYWPGGVVPYMFHSSITSQEKSTIERAIAHWQEETCLTFREREGLDYMYIRFRSDTPGCWSLVGRQFLRIGVGQDVSIGKGCAQHHVVTHEIGHAVGFFHEQSRSDRDEAIYINWPNVQEGFELQFEKEEDVNFGIPYDYMSVMQYPSWAFSKRVLEKNTVVTVDPKYQRLLGKNTKGLSFRDKAIMNRLYNCEKACPNFGKTICNNQGYLKSSGRSDPTQPCKCECPPNTSGANCEIKTNDDYYEALEPLACGGNVTEEGVLETPGYPARIGPKQSCAWVIRSPPGNRIQLTFEGFEFAPRHVKPGSKTHNKCYHEAVEIRLEDDRNGDHFCGSDITPGTVMTSTGNQAVVLVMADEKMLGRGLRMMVNFVDPNAPSSSTSTTVSPPSESPPPTPNPSSVPPEGVDPTVPSINRNKNPFGGTTRRPVTPPVIGATESPFETAWKQIISAWRNRKPPPPPGPTPGKSGGTGGGIGGVVPPTPSPFSTPFPPTWMRSTTSLPWNRMSSTPPSFTFPPPIVISGGNRVVIG